MPERLALTNMVTIGIGLGKMNMLAVPTYYHFCCLGEDTDQLSVVLEQRGVVDATNQKRRREKENAQSA